MPTQAELSEYYAAEYSENSLAESEAARPAMRRVLAEIEAKVPVGRILDVGCGYGMFLEEARRLGWTVQGVEPTPERAEAARGRGLPVVSGTLEQACFETGSFDVVVLQHVIEHLTEPRVSLAEISRILRPGGLLYVACPNAGSVEARLAGAGWGWFCPPAHVFHYTPAGLKTLLETSGYGVAGWRTDHGADRGGLLFNAMLGARANVTCLRGASNGTGNGIGVAPAGVPVRGRGERSSLSRVAKRAAWAVSGALDWAAVPVLALSWKAWGAQMEFWARSFSTPSGVGAPGQAFLTPAQPAGMEERSHVAPGR